MKGIEVRRYREMNVAASIADSQNSADKGCTYTFDPFEG